MPTYVSPDRNFTIYCSVELHDLLVESDKAIRELKKINKSAAEASKGVDKLESSAKGAGNSLGKLTNIAKAVSAALVSSTVIVYAQSWNELEDRIQNTGATASQTKDILDQLLATSDRNGRTIEESSELYIRLSNSMKELGYSTQSTLSYIGSMSDLFTINKTSAVGTESAINALTKAQMKGKLAGVEAMTVFSNMPSVLGTLTNYLKKNAKSTKDAEKITEQYVRQMATDGKLSIQTFTDALIDSNAELDALADNMRNTVQDGINRVTNNLKKYFGELNNSTGATKLLVDSLILMSQHVDILMTGVGALAAIYAGKYITSLANATKQSVEKTIADMRQAQAEKVLLQAEVERTSQNVKALQIQKQNIIMAQAHCNNLKAQMALNKQLEVVEKQLVTATNEHAMAQARLDTAMKATNIAARGLRATMAMLGGPAGMLLLAAGALTIWSSKAEEAKQKAENFTDTVDSMSESLKNMTFNQLLDKQQDYTDSLENIDDQISKTKGKIEQLKQSILGQKAELGSFAPSIKEDEKQIVKLNATIDTLIQKKENAGKIISFINTLLSKTGENTDSAAKKTKSLDDALKSVGENKIDNKVKSLSTQREIAEMKLYG